MTSAAAAPADMSGRIRAAAPGLNGALGEVAEYVLTDLAGTMHATIGELAQASGTSPATITRFCRALGLGSYRELKLAIAEELGRSAINPALNIGQGIEPGDDMSRVAAVVVHADLQAIQQTAAQLNLAAVDESARAIARARRVDVVGTGGSGTSATELYLRLHRIGCPVWVWTENHLAETSAHLLTPDDVAVGVSHSGGTRETVEPLAIARDRGATTVAITNRSRSPLAKLADHVLTTAALETSFRHGGLAARHSQLVVVDCLYIRVAQLTGDRARTALNRTAGITRAHEIPADRPMRRTHRP